MRHTSLALPRLLTLLLLAASAFVAPAFAATEDDRRADEDEYGYEETARVARVSLIRGDVSLRRAGGDKWERAALNFALVEGDRLATGAGARLEIQIDARNFVRVGEYATVEIVTLRDEGVALSLIEGTATLRLARFDKSREYFEIDAPGTTVAAERAGLYRLDVAQSGRVRVTVRNDGRARIYSQDSGFALRDGRAAELSSSGGAGELDWQFSDASGLDAWDTWVDDRERYLASRLRHDGRERYYDDTVWGAEELDAYGDWVETREYGYVWRPHATVINNYHDWAPYRYGRWTWLPHYGWTWVGDEPWGWAPYHYGRWVYVNNYWCWAPRGYVGYHRRRSWWRPALVAFVYIPSSYGERVCWYPLPYHRRDPHSNFWRRALERDRRREDEEGRRRTSPIYHRAVSSKFVRDFGRHGAQITPVDDVLARKALASEPVRGKLPVKPSDGGGAGGGDGRGRAGGGGLARGAGGNNNNGAGRGDIGPNDAKPLRLTERPTGAAARRAGVALDDELRRTRVFNSREPAFGKGPKGGAGDGGGGGGDSRGTIGRPTGAVARPARPVAKPGDDDGGDDDKRGSRRVRPGTPDANPTGSDSEGKRTGGWWRTRPGERDGGGDTNNDATRTRTERPERPTRPSDGDNNNSKPPRVFRPEPQPKEDRPAPPPREERQRPEPRYERPAPREERSPPPQREERPSPPPRQERPSPPPREEKRSDPPRDTHRPSRGKDGKDG